MPVNLQVHDVIPDVAIDMDKQRCDTGNEEQGPVSAGKSGFLDCHCKAQQDGTQGKGNKPLDPQDTRERPGVDVYSPRRDENRVSGFRV